MNPDAAPPLSSGTSSIWLVEDHEIFAKQLQRLISSEESLHCPYYFTNAAQFYDKLRSSSERPDAVLLDLGLPGRNGLQVLADLREIMPNIKVLILTAYDDKERVYQAICNGASGYLLKTSEPDDIISAIHDVINGVSALSGPIARMILDGFAKFGPVEKVEPLTSREENVLHFLVKGRIKKEIADELGISPHTVDMHLRSIYRKLQVRSQTEAVAKAIRQGIV